MLQLVRRVVLFSAIALPMCAATTVSAADSVGSAEVGESIRDYRSRVFSDFDPSGVKGPKDSWLWLDNTHSYCKKLWVVAEYRTVDGKKGKKACPPNWDCVPAGKKVGYCDSEVKIKKVRFSWVGHLGYERCSKWWTAPDGFFIYDCRIVWKHCNGYEYDANDYQPLP